MSYECKRCGFKFHKEPLSCHNCGGMSFIKKPETYGDRSNEGKHIIFGGVVIFITFILIIILSILI